MSSLLFTRFFIPVAFPSSSTAPTKITVPLLFWIDAAANNIAINGALASEAPLPYNESPSILTLIFPGTVSICPHKRILGKPEPFLAIKFPTSSICISSKPRSSHLSARKSAIGFSLSEGVYNLRAFSNIFTQNLGVTVNEVCNFYLDDLRA